MTAPQDPFGTPPEGGPPPPFGQPAYGQPAYGQPGGPELAGWGLRVAAALIDTLIATAIYLVPLVVGAVSGSDLVAGLLTLFGFVGQLAFLAWNHVRQGRTGQTVGKGVVGTRLLREQDGQVVGAGLSIGRYFVHFLDAIPCLLGYLWPLWDAKKQTFADKLLSTVVVKA